MAASAPGRSVLGTASDPPAGQTRKVIGGNRAELPIYDPLAGLPRVHRMGARKVAARRTDPHRARTRTRTGPAPGPASGPTPGPHRPRSAPAPRPAPGPPPDPHPDPHRARTRTHTGPAPGPHRTDSPRPLGGELALIQLGVKAVLGQQLVVSALLHDAAFVHHQHDVRVSDGGQPMRD